MQIVRQSTFLLLIVLFLTIGFVSKAQYVRFVFQEPQKAGTAINTDAEETMALLSPDGSILYFSRAISESNVGGTKGGQDIWVTEAVNGEFKATATPVAPFNNRGNNAVVGVGKEVLYLLNVYKGGDKMKAGISMTSGSGGAWSEPIELDIPGLELKGDFYGFWMNPEGDTLLISMDGKGSKGREDIYVSFRAEDGKWSKPLNLGSSINSAGYDISPWLDKDGKRLFFASNGKGGFGEADIFMSVRQDNSWTNWSYPMNLGKNINSRGFDAFLVLDGAKAYFASNRDGGLADIYVSEFQRLKPGQKIKKELPEQITVYFKFNDYMLYDEQKKQLDEVVKLMKKDRDLKVIVSGYTCDIGDNQTNEKLSGLRAESVLTYFVIKGIYENRITVKHYGEVEATEFNKTENDRELNRRVDIRFTND